jgi:DNA (cytosine-5)-methyltransferase 1
MKNRKLSYIDLFAGAGGWSVGFDSAGFENVQMYDVNQSACNTAEFNFGKVVKCCDLSSSKTLKFPKVDVVIGSPPCQGFSNEGKKKIDDPRNSLVWDFMDIIEKIRPKIWVFENVPGFKRSYKGKFFQEMAKRLNTSGYLWRDFILDAANFGIPQHRKRFFIIGCQDFLPAPPSPTHFSDSGMFDGEPIVSLWDAISDLPIPILGDRIGEFTYMKSAKSDFQNLMRENSTRIHNHTAQKHSDRVLEKIRAVPAGGNMTSLVNRYKENNVKYEGGYRRATKDSPSYTAYWTRGMTSIHPVQDRFLTPRECARIQSFPDKFIFQGNTIENYTQICNSVPPLLSLSIANSIKNQVNQLKKLPVRKKTG